MTPAERLRKHQRALEKTQRELDRERVKLENQEKKLVVPLQIFDFLKHCCVLLILGSISFLKTSSLRPVRVRSG